MSQAPEGQRRLGPRPLAQHWATALTSWSGCALAWGSWSAGSPNWKADPGSKPKRDLSGKLPPNLADLAESLEKAEPAAFAAALNGEIARRIEKLKAGIEAYQTHPYRRDLPAPNLLWQEGSSKLLDYRGFRAKSKSPGRASPTAAERPALLVVPSLVNRAYVLDLMEGRSFMRWFAQQGFDPFLVDWDAPGSAEKNFTLTDYIAGRLEAALDALRREVKQRPIFLIGYCMGGDLALALALRRQKDFAGLALMATPWDFHAERPEQAKFLGAMGQALAPMLALLGELPVDGIQSLFAGLDPFQIIRKFQTFAALDPTSDKARQFVALEDWLNDGVALTAGVARECLEGWYGENQTGRGVWQIDGRRVRPEELSIPSLVIVPDQDRIVPPLSAAALARSLPKATSLSPAAGHIGMAVGSKAESVLWEPMRDWLCR